MRKEVKFNDAVFEIILKKGNFLSGPSLQINQGDMALYREERSKKDYEILLDLYQDDDKLKKKLLAWGETMQTIVNLDHTKKDENRS